MKPTLWPLDSLRRLSRTGHAPEPCTLPCHPPQAGRRRVAAEQQHPRLWVWQVCPGRWMWQLIGPNAETLDSALTHTHGEALAVGLAALEVASVTGANPPLTS